MTDRSSDAAGRANISTSTGQRICADSSSSSSSVQLVPSQGGDRAGTSHTRDVRSTRTTHEQTRVSESRLLSRLSLPRYNTHSLVSLACSPTPAQSQGSGASHRSRDGWHIQLYGRYLDRNPPQAAEQDHLSPGSLVNSSLPARLDGSRERPPSQLHLKRTRRRGRRAHACALSLSGGPSVVHILLLQHRGRGEAL